MSNRRIEIGLAFAIALLLIARNLQEWRNPVREQMTDLSIGANWIAENTPTDAIVMVNEPVPAYVHVKRQTINFPKNGQELQKYLDNQGIDYIIIAPPLQSPRSADLSVDVKRTAVELGGSPEAYKLVFEDRDNNVRVYQYTSGE